MKEIIITDPEEKKKLVDNFFSNLEPGEFTEGLSDLINPDYGGWETSPYNHLFLSTYFWPIEKGYFGENKVRFEDSSYEDDENNIIELSNAEFFDALVQKAEMYAKKYPNEKEEIEELLPKVKKVLNLD